MKILLTLICGLFISCNSVNHQNGVLVAKRELFLTRETNYKKIPEYFISRIEVLNTKPSDRIYTLGAIHRGTMIPYHSIERRGDLYIGSSTIYRGDFVYQGINYPYEATFFDDEINEYVNVK